MGKFQFLGVGLVALLATACSAVGAQPTATAPAGVNQPSTSSVSSAPNTPEPTEEETTDAPPSESVDDMTAKFGEAFAWEDGLSLTISKPTAYKPSEYAAAGDKFKKFVVFDVRVVNKTGKTWDPSLLYLTMQSSNQEGDRVFDSSKLGDEPNTKLLNGREAKFKVAFGVADPADLVLEVTPDFDHESALFTS